jgi:hypothetical protein
LWWFFVEKESPNLLANKVRQLSGTSNSNVDGIKFSLF